MDSGVSVSDEDLAGMIAAIRTAGSDTAEVEAKRSRDELPTSLRKSLSAFSNTAGGGIVILGLDEQAGFAASGVADPARIASDLADMCATQFEPPIRPLIAVHQFEGEQLVVAEVPEVDPGSKPCFYKGQGMTTGSFVRTGDGNYHLTAYEVQMMVASRSQPRDDEQPVDGATLHDLDSEAAARLLHRLRTNQPAVFADISDEDALHRARVLVATEVGEIVPSLAGLLALGSYPQQFFPQLNLTFVAYPTTEGAALATGERFLDNRSFDGPIPVIVRDALDAIRRNMSRRAIIQGVGREDVWEYPEPALREAIVNALVHRDLSGASRGSQVQVEMFPDRLVVRNPGGLFGPVTVNRLGEEAVSSARNAVLLRLLESVAIPGETRTVCENRGSGIRVMMQSLRAAGMRLPEFVDRISAFQVTFPNHTLLDSDTLAWIEQLGQAGLTDSQYMALATMRGGSELTNGSYRQQMGVDSRVATAELQDLVARELVDQAGVHRWATYSLAKRLQQGAEPRRRPTPPADRRDEMMRALGTRVMSRAELVEITGLTPQTVRRWLKILQDEGRVSIEGKPQSNKARYYAIVPIEPDGQLALRWDDTTSDSE